MRLISSLGCYFRILKNCSIGFTITRGTNCFGGSWMLTFANIYGHSLFREYSTVCWVSRCVTVYFLYFGHEQNLVCIRTVATTFLSDKKWSLKIIIMYVDRHRDSACRYYIKYFILFLQLRSFCVYSGYT